MIEKPKKIIYFIADGVPTEAEIEAARAYGFGVVFRNAAAIPADVSPGQIEECDGVAGLVPAAYKEKYKESADVAKESKKAEVKGRSAIEATATINPFTTKA